MLVVAVAVTTYPRRAALARAPFCRPSLIRRPEVPCTKTGQIDRAQQASPESATLRSLSERLTLVTAVTGILLRHGCKIPNVPPTALLSRGLCFLPINSSAEVLCFLNSGTRVAPRFCVLSQSEGPLVWQPRSISTPLAGVPWLPSLSASTG